MVSVRFHEFNKVKLRRAVGDKQCTYNVAGNSFNHYAIVFNRGCTIQHELKKEGIRFTFVVDSVRCSPVCSLPEVRG